MEKSNLEKYLEEWYPGLQKETRTLKEVLAEMPGYKQHEIPLFVWLLENPKSPIAMPGYIDLFNHDCVHILLGRGLLAQDEAFVIGFTMGNSTSVNKLHCFIFKTFSLYFYPKNFKLQKRDLFAFDLGFQYGRNRKIRNINKIDFHDRANLNIGEIRQQLDIAQNDLIELRKKEAEKIPSTKESTRLLVFD
jgi:hypothetical protein